MVGVSVRSDQLLPQEEITRLSLTLAHSLLNDITNIYNNNDKNIANLLKIETRIRRFFVVSF